ncbi:hypothetical protein HAX54_050899 [Datura stramonium]|uniref:Uncharacterized protein n=1 Tax=Datura stramonium TaxID=4076 RepID=A0ABS8SXM8_DATST|nr:hypothetical protein [Datura stramonium]
MEISFSLPPTVVRRSETEKVVKEGKRHEGGGAGGFQGETAERGEGEGSRLMTIVVVTKSFIIDLMSYRRSRPRIKADSLNVIDARTTTFPTGVLLCPTREVLLSMTGPLGV